MACLCGYLYSRKRPTSNSQCPVADSAGPSAQAERFETTRQRIPHDIGAPASQSSQGDEVRLQVEMPGLVEGRIRDVSFFPFTEGLMENPAPQSFRLLPNGLEITVQQGLDFAPGTAMDGIVVIEEHSGESLVSAFEINPTVDAAPAPVTEPGIGLWTALGFAFLGGLILNLMPCVFPVLSIKILSLMNQVGTHSSAIRLHGWVYLAGVRRQFHRGRRCTDRAACRRRTDRVGIPAAVSCCRWPAGLPVLRDRSQPVRLFRDRHEHHECRPAGHPARWLFRLVPHGRFSHRRRGPLYGALHGQRNRFCADPDCNPIAVSTFAALGLGMATPYVVLCYSPALMDRLPRPGPWMARFRELLAFPMFGAAVWLGLGPVVSRSALRVYWRWAPAC
ncbi:MAG: hypothetical protein U5O39_13520 [Gammaproteobacteria bacterium]|nr:hypothetical protein [Gammaproteobacteria bacterium]